MIIHIIEGLYYHVNNLRFRSPLKVTDCSAPVSRSVICFKGTFAMYVVEMLVSPPYEGELAIYCGLAFQR